MEKTSQSLDDTFQNIDLRMNNLREISSRILTTQQFANIYLNERPGLLSFYSITEIIRNYIIPNEFIHDIWIYDRNNMNFFSSVHMLSMDSFTRYGPVYPGLGKNFLDIADSIRGDMWIPLNQVRIFRTDYSLLTYITAYPYSSTHNNTVVVMFINEAILERALRVVIPYQNSTAAVVDSGGQIIYSLNSSLNPALAKILALGMMENGTMINRIDDDDYFIRIMHSQQNQLTYISIIPYRELTAEVRNHTQVFSIFLLGIVLFGSVLIFLLMRFNYKPLREIFRLYSSFNRTIKIQNEGEELGGNEIELIRKTLENISEENKVLSKKIRQVEVLSKPFFEVENTINNEREIFPNQVNKDNILKFIDGNYQDSSFCIQSVLDHFNISLSNLSHQFKSYMGTNISTYISNLKMSYAKELLSTGDTSVNDIARKLGYFQTSSFIKRFKSSEGMTPGEYRQRL